MARDAQKAEERVFLDVLEKTVSGLEITQLGESPDALARIGRRKVGIEVRRLLLSDSRRAKESLKDSIMSAAHAAYESQEALPALLVCVLFRPHLSMDRDRAEDVGERLGRKIAARVKADNTVGRLQEGLPRPVASITFAKLNEGAAPVWEAVRRGFIPEIGACAIQKALRHKEKKLPSYRKTTSEMWLLLAVEGFQPSTWWDVDGSALKAEYATGFDRVYVVDYQRRESIRLNTSGA